VVAAGANVVAGAIVVVTGALVVVAGALVVAGATLVAVGMRLAATALTKHWYLNEEDDRGLAESDLNPMDMILVMDRFPVIVPAPQALAASLNAMSPVRENMK